MIKHIESPAQSARFRIYLSGIGAGAFAGGLQIVLYPWLVAGVLGESPQRVGYAQMAVLLPTLVFVLLGGALSETRHLGLLLFRYYLVYLLPYGLLLVLAATDSLVYPLVVLFGLGYGVITSLVQPARESLLPQIAGDKLREAIAKTSLVQFLFQGTGMLFAGRLEQVGLIALCIFQMVVMTTAAIFFYRSLPFDRYMPASTGPLTRSAIRNGFSLVWNHRSLRYLMAAVATTGFLGLGVYVVVMPLLAREVYDGDAAFFAALQVTFVAGVIVANMAMVRGPGSAWVSNRLISWSLLFRGGLLCLMASGLPLWGLFSVVLLWGVFSGWSMVLGRTLTHEMTPRSYRGRVVSVYQLCLFGAAPVGAWTCGHLVEAVGVLPAIAVFGVLTVLIALLLLKAGPLTER